MSVLKFHQQIQGKSHLHILLINGDTISDNWNSNTAFKTSSLF